MQSIRNRPDEMTEHIRARDMSGDDLLEARWGGPYPNFRLDWDSNLPELPVMVQLDASYTRAPSSIQYGCHICHRHQDPALREGAVESLWPGKVQLRTTGVDKDR